MSLALGMGLDVCVGVRGIVYTDEDLMKEGMVHTYTKHAA
jgi:hypothetical protein